MNNIHSQYILVLLFELSYLSLLFIIRDLPLFIIDNESSVSWMPFWVSIVDNSR
jgi:hypothetical protein